MPVVGFVLLAAGCWLLATDSSFVERKVALQSRLLEHLSDHSPCFFVCILWQPLCISAISGPRSGCNYCSRFFSFFCSKVCVEHLSGEGGFVAVHSTLTNAQMRAWLDPLRAPNPSSTLRGQSNLVPDRSLEPSLRLGPDASPCTDPGPHSSLKQETHVNPTLDGTPAPSRAYELVALSLLEPLKLFQNSCTLFQKRAQEYSEPVYSEYP